MESQVKSVDISPSATQNKNQLRTQLRPRLASEDVGGSEAPGMVQSGLWRNARCSTTTLRPTSVLSGKWRWVRSPVRDARWLLALQDRLGRALASVPQPDPDHASWQAALYPWIEDLARVSREIHAALLELGVEPSAHRAEVFDPTYHTAVGGNPAVDAGQQHILRVVKQGFRLGPHVLRKARVVTCR